MDSKARKAVRSFVPINRAEARLDKAYQLLLQWASEQKDDRNEQEKEDESSILHKGFNPSSSSGNES